MLDKRIEQFYNPDMADILYIARRGDWLAKIAQKFNIADPDAIYNHPPNEGLRNRRSQQDLLAPGDEVWIPVEDELEVPTKGKNDGPVDITVTSPDAERLMITLKNEEGEAWANKDFTLNYPDQEEETTGTTDGDGKIDEEIPAGTSSATIRIEDKTLQINIGHLDPADELSGFANRLKNLAGYTGPIPRQMTTELYDAICKFQEDNELTVDGTMNRETVDKLVELYGC